MNRLSKEKSPYLQQHAHNPVDWYAWGPEAFERAREKNQLIFLSVGYSTCHWCHVMERESFEDADVASVLNRSFVSIKVDREERPDVDAVYMDAIQGMTGQGGWPMSVFLTPDRKPFFGGTYFPKHRFISALEQLESHWATDPARIREAGDHLLEWMKEKEPKSGAPVLNEGLLRRFLQKTKENFDFTCGGRQGAPKFPPAAELRLLLRIHRRTGDLDALEMVKKTLDEMGRGGIYDALAGGFHRYSTDEQWLVPHFEKMLYDQAAMVQAYLEAFQVTRSSEYELIARETLDYVLEQMTSPEGAFYSAEDADSEGVEGKFYVWTFEELKARLSSVELAEFSETFGVSENGNFEEQKNILTLSEKHTRGRRSETLKASMLRLKALRAKRTRPLRDEKIITSWNALMITAMAKAARVLQEPRYLRAASDSARFLLKNLRNDEGDLQRRWMDGEAAHSGFLDDSAFLIESLLELYQADFEVEWLRTATDLQRRQDRLFLDPDTGSYFFAPEGDSSLIRRQKEFFDNVQPSGNSVTALNLFKLYGLTLDGAVLERARSLLQSLPSEVEHYPSAFPQLLFVLDLALPGAKEVAVVGPRASADFIKSIAELNSVFAPELVLAAGAPGESDPRLLAGKTDRDGQPLIYLCESHSCQVPVSDLSVVVSRLDSRRARKASSPSNGL